MQLEFSQMLNNISQSTDLPLLAAFALGLLVALNPCQLAICVSALTYEYKRGKTFTDIIMYTLGRTTTYTLLGWITMCLIGGGKNIVPIQQMLSYAEIGVPYLLILIGIFLLIRGFHRHQHDGENCHNSGKIIKRNAPLGSFVLGMALALIFCPESAIFYFGMMIPLSISSSIGILVPLAFGISASLPTIIVAWFLKKAIDKAETISKKFEHFQQWLNIATGLLFISIAILLLMHD